MNNDPLGLLDEEDDPLGLMEDEQPQESLTNFITNPKDDRDSKALKSDFDQMGTLRQIGELAVGTPEAIASIATSLPGMLAQGASTGANLMLGMGLEDSVKAGKEQAERFTYKPRSTAGQMIVNDAGQLIEKGAEIAGNVSAKVHPSSMENIARTGGEAMFNATLGGVPGVGALRGIRARRMYEQQAREMIEKRQMGVEEYQSWVDDQVKNDEYRQQLAELDNVMMKYNQDMQAPQLGKGGKVARIPDQDAKRATGEFANQADFDADIAKTAKDYRAFEYQQAERQRLNPDREVPTPLTETGRRPVEGKTNIIGPAGRLKPEVTAADEIGIETRAMMSARDRPQPLPFEIDEGVADDAASGVRSAFMQREREKGAPSVGAVKDPGGNWHPMAKDDFMAGLRASRNIEAFPNENPGFIAWRDWADKAVDRYLQRYAGTERDPLKDIEVPFEGGTVRWEELTDAVVSSRPAKDYAYPGNTQGAIKGMGKLVKEGKVKPDDPIWQTNMFGQREGSAIPRREAHAALMSYLEHVRDYATANIRRGDLGQYDFTRMVRETAEWDKKLAKNMEKQQKDSMKNATVHKDYGDGFKWIKLDKPGQFAQESDMMGHSVRGYEPWGADGRTHGNHPDYAPGVGGGHQHYGLGGWDAIKRGDAEVYSLRDAQGRAHVTIEVRTAQDVRYRDMDHERELRQRDPKPEITQIKGKQNRAPEEKYLKYVQDFVKSQEWGHVGDLNNTGLNFGLDWIGKYADAEKWPDDVYRNELTRLEIQGLHKRLITQKEFEQFLRDETQGEPPLPSRTSMFWRPELGDIQKMAPYDHSINFRTMLDDIKRNSKIPYYKKLAEFLLEDKQFNPRFQVKDELGDSAGLYESNKYAVSLKKRYLGDETLTLHEGIHARTHGAIELGLRVPDQNPRLKVAVRRLQDVYLAFRDQVDLQAFSDPNATRVKDIYGLTNIHEFIAEGFTNPEFQALLAKTPLPKKLQKSKYHTYWDRFLDAIGKLLGLDQDRQTYLGEVLRIGAEIMREADTGVRTWLTDENTINRTKSPYETVGGQYTYRDFKNDLDMKGIKVADSLAKKMFEESKLADKPDEVKSHPQQGTLKVLSKIDGLKKIQEQYVPSLTWEEMLERSKQRGDVTMVGKNVVAKILGGKFTNTDHPAWTFASSQIHDIKSRSMQSSMDRLHGKSRKNPDPGTYNYHWHRLTTKEREQVNDFGWKYNNSERAVSSAELAALPPKLREAYKDRVRINKEVLADVNKHLEAEGKDPIPPMPNYWSPIIVDGPFVVKFKDTTGETKKIADFYLKPDMKKVEKLAKEHGMTAELMPERGLRGELDFEQLDWVLRHLNKELRDPAAKALSEGLRRQGFTRHGLKRKRDTVQGGAGSGGGRRGLREYEETSEKYIRRAYEWVSNRELDKLYNKVLDEKSLDSQPYAKAFALEAIDAARGGSNQHFEGFSKLVGDVLSGAVQISTLGAVKLPNRAARDLIRHSNKIKTTLLLGFGHPVQIGANILQAPYSGMFGLTKVAAEAGLGLDQMAPAIIKALHKTGNEMIKWDDSKDIAKLRSIGALDATFKYDWSTYASDSAPQYAHTIAEHATGISTLSYIESNAVRRPASLMFLNLLREIGYEQVAKNKDEIYYVAKELTDKYMVSTKWYEKPHAFSRSGLVGTAISPLQSFTTTWLGMLKEASQLSAQGLVELSVAKQMPLGVFMGLHLMTAGMLGMIGIKEWDSIATLINKWFGYNIPTGTEWVMSEFKNNKMRFGILSDALGYHVGATFGAPTLTGSFAPGLQLLGNAANFGYQSGRYISNQFGLGADKPTAVERREAMKGVFPRFNWGERAVSMAGGPELPLSWGNIEKQATPPGLPYQDSAGNAGPVTRDDADWRARQWGTYTTKEATEKAENYLGKRAGDERSKRLSSSIERMVDILVMNPNDPSIMEKLEPFFKKLEEDQFKGNEIKNALKRELLNKIVESDARMVGRGQSSRQAHIYKLLEQLR